LRSRSDMLKLHELPRAHPGSCRRMERSAGRLPDPLEEVLERYGSLLRGAIARACPKDLGLQFDDIEQEARVRIWRALQGETEIARPASYLYRVAVTATLDAVRRAVARREEQLWTTGSDMDPAGTPAAAAPAGSNTSPESVAHNRLLLEKVRAVLQRLAPRKRSAVGLHIRGFTPEEIGRLLGWSEPRARSLVYRGLKELRAKLAAEGIEYER